jgi:hypothetical protein
MELVSVPPRTQKVPGVGVRIRTPRTSSRGRENDAGQTGPRDMFMLRGRSVAASLWISAAKLQHENKGAGLRSRAFLKRLTKKPGFPAGRSQIMDRSREHGNQTRHRRHSSVQNGTLEPISAARIRSGARGIRLGCGLNWPLITGHTIIVAESAG